MLQPSTERPRSLAWARENERESPRKGFVPLPLPAGLVKRSVEKPEVLRKPRLT